MLQRIEKVSEIDASVETVYRVVADVTKYPEFLPGVASVKQQGDIVEMTVNLGPIYVTWKSRATLEPNAWIEIDLVEGPFKRMDVRWEFTPRGGATEVRYVTHFELNLRVPGISRVVARAIKANTESTIRAFRKRILSLDAG